MRLDAIQPHRAVAAESIVPHWRAPLLRLVLSWLAVFGLFAQDWAEMVMQWWNSSTYNHILLVPAILGWLVWQRVDELTKLTPRAWWPGLAALAGAMLVWLLGDVSGTATLSHLGLVLALQALTLTLLGPRVCWALFFPLCYALFLVPIGEELVPALQMITADITIALTEVSGIPAHIDGVFIDTPAGLFEVAEACSGVKFLIAMIALGTLVSHVMFESWWRRAGFMALAIVLPIIANGIRAWGTIYIAQSQGIAFAAGFDHIFYGWIFFALVMGLLLGIGWKFFDRSIDEAFIDGDAIAAQPFWSGLEKGNGRGWPVFLAAMAVILTTMLWAGQSRALEADIAPPASLPEIAGWVPVPSAKSYPWAPLAGGADHVVRQSYRDADGRRVDVVYALYAAQGEGREAGAYGQGALPPDTEWRWLAATVSSDGVAGERLQALGRHRRSSETWFRSGDWIGNSTVQLKLRTMQDRLFLTARPAAMLIISAEEDTGVDGVEAIADFRTSTGDLGAWMDRAGGVD